MLAESFSNISKQSKKITVVGASAFAVGCSAALWYSLSEYSHNRVLTVLEHISTLPQAIKDRDGIMAGKMLLEPITVVYAPEARETEHTRLAPFLMEEEGGIPDKPQIEALVKDIINASGIDILSASLFREKMQTLLFTKKLQTVTKATVSSSVSEYDMIDTFEEKADRRAVTAAFFLQEMLKEHNIQLETIEIGNEFAQEVLPEDKEAILALLGGERIEADDIDHVIAMLLHSYEQQVPLPEDLRELLADVTNRQRVVSMTLRYQGEKSIISVGVPVWILLGFLLLKRKKHIRTRSRKKKYVV